MGVYLVFIGYFGVAAFTAGYVYYHGVAMRPRPVLFGPGERVALWLTCAAVGATWVLFVPALLVHEVRHARGGFEINPRTWKLALDRLRGLATGAGSAVRSR